MEKNNGGKKVDNVRQYLTKIHPDFHIPDGVEVGKDLDGTEYAQKIKKARADSAAVFAKCHYGYSYYPTEAGTEHPGLSKDFFGEITRGFREVNLGVTGYYSVFLDTAAVKKNPEWILRDDPEKTISQLMKGTKYLPVCVNSRYYEDLMLPQVREIIEKYDIDELLFDTMSQFVPCYCSNCRQSFGREIPRNEDDPNWLEYVKWYYQQYEDFFARLVADVKDLNSDISIVVNWKWSARLPNDPVPNIERLIGDLFTSGATGSFFSRYWAGTGYDFDYMCGRFLHHLGDWSSNTPETLKYTAASTIANGGSFYLIDRQKPDGSLEERAYKITEDVFSFVKERKNVVMETEHVPETAFLYPFEHVVGSKLQYFPDNQARSDRIRQFKGAANIFRNHGHHYTAMNSTQLIDNLDQYQLLILPELEFLSKNMIQQIKEFVQTGGKLFIVQSKNAEAVQEEIFALAGVEYKKHTDRDYSYIDNYDRGVFDPILVRGKFARVTPGENTKVLADLISPEFAGDKDLDFGHGFAPAGKAEGFAAVTEHQLGQGQVIYVSGPLFTSHHTYFNPDISELVLNIYNLLLPEPLVRVESPAQVEMTAVKKNNDLIVHLVNHSGREVQAGGFCPVTEFIPQLKNIKVSVKVKAGKEIHNVNSYPGGTPVDTSVENNYLHCNISALDIMESILFADYFA